MPIFFGLFKVDNYGIISAQTNQIITTACLIVKLQQSNLTKAKAQSFFKYFLLLDCILMLIYLCCYFT